MPQTLFSLTLTVLAAGLLVYCGFLVYLYCNQAAFIYHPSRELDATPADIGLAWESLVLTAEDGVPITAWWVPREGGRGTVLVCHGNGGNIADRLDSIEILHRLGMHVLVFDYRGYGTSAGKPSEAGTYRDVEAAWRWLVDERGIPAGRIVVLGRSLGGAVAARCALTHAPGGLVLESTFTSMPDVAAEFYPWYPARPLTRHTYATIDIIGRVRCPILIVHSPDDTVVPFHHGETLFAAAPEPRTFLRITGRHNDGFLTTGRPYIDGLDAFFGGVCGPLDIGY